MIALVEGAKRQKRRDVANLASNPTKLIEIIEIGKQLLMKRPLHSARCAVHSARCAGRARVGAPLPAREGLARRLLQEIGMEILSLALAVGFFALSWGLVVLCERLLG